MAITARSTLPPASVAPSRKKIVQQGASAVLALVPDIRPGVKADQTYFARLVFAVGAFGLLALLGINTLLSQDAFELHRLSVESTKLIDQKEALMRQIAVVSSPEKIAERAVALGMVESKTPRFLTLTPAPSMPQGVPIPGLSQG